MPPRPAAFARTVPRSTKRRAGRTRVSETPLHIHVSGIELSAKLDETARQLLGRRLRRFGTHIAWASVRFEDINGPRGGVDTECSIQLAVTGRPTLFVRHRAIDPEVALRRAAAAAARALARVVGRARLSAPAPTRAPRKFKTPSETSAQSPAAAGERSNRKAAARARDNSRVGRAVRRAKNTPKRKATRARAAR